MDNSKIEQKLEENLQKALCELAQQTPGTQVYGDMVDQIETLYRLRINDEGNASEEKARCKQRRIETVKIGTEVVKTILSIGATVFMFGSMLVFEQTGTVTSKTLQFISKNLIKT